MKVVKYLTTLLFGLFFTCSIALAEDKLTVMLLTSESCPMCVQFEEEVLPDVEVKKALSEFIFKKVSAQKSKIRVNVTPTVVIFDKNNREIDRFIPATNKKKFITSLKKAREKANTKDI